MGAGGAADPKRVGGPHSGLEMDGEAPRTLGQKTSFHTRL